MGTAPVSKPTNDINRSIVWLDASIRNTDEYINAQRLLRTPLNHLKVYKDDQECENYIRSIPREHRVILIVDEKFGQLLVPRVHQLLQISAIFVHGMEKKNIRWTKQYKKIKGSTDNVRDLVNQVLSVQGNQTGRDRLEEPVLIDIYNRTDSHDQSKNNEKFIQSQKLIYSILKARPTSPHKNELITYCEREYAKNTQQLNHIREFQQEYSATSAIRWYTKDSFLYKLLNKAFRTQNLELLNLLGFFIRDLYQQLKRNQCSRLLHVYRGQLMPKDEIQKLQHSIGQLISINSFVSTTPDYEAAVTFSGNTETSTSHLQPVLFEIEADPRIIGIKPFADITSSSYMPNEKEVLMMLGSIFRLVNVHQDGALCVINLVLCSENDSDIKPIFDQMHVDSQDKGSTNSSRVHSVLTTSDKIDEDMKPIRRESRKSTLNTVSETIIPLRRESKKPNSKASSPSPTPVRRESKKPNSKASSPNPTPIRRESKRPMLDPFGSRANATRSGVQFQNTSNVAPIKSNLKVNFNVPVKPPEIIQKTLKPDDPSVIAMHHDNGRVFYANGQYKQANQSYHKALSINRQAFDEDHSKVAESFTNVGNIHFKQGEYAEALLYLQKALGIRQKHLAADHPLIGQSYRDIAGAYRGLRKYNSALEFYNKALRIYEKCKPPQTHNMAITYNGIGTVHSAKHNYQLALEYYEKAATIFRQTVPANHRDALEVQKNINEVHNTVKIK